MTTCDPQAHADAAQEALRRLAHATREVKEPTDIYPVLGQLSRGLSSLAQSLHQIADAHDGPAGRSATVGGDARAGRAASYQVAWELHRAAEMAHQVASGIGGAHEIEATIAYDIDDLPDRPGRPGRPDRLERCSGPDRHSVAAVQHRPSEPGLSL